MRQVESGKKDCSEYMSRLEECAAKILANNDGKSHMVFFLLLSTTPIFLSIIISLSDTISINFCLSKGCVDK